MIRRWSRQVALLVSLASAALVFSPAPALADRKEDAAKAAARGDHAFARADYGKALEEYQASYDRYPKPFLLFKLAECQRNLGKTADALESYKQYVAKVSKGADRKKAASYVAQLSAAAAEPEKPEPLAPVAQDHDVEAPPMKAAEVKAARGKKGPPPITTASAPKADVVPPGYDPSAPPPEPTAAFVAPEDRRSSDGPKPLHKKWWLWTAVAGGAVVLGVGLGLGLTLGLPKFTSELPVGGPGASALTVRY